MSTFVRELVLVRRGFADRVELTRRLLARATAGPLLVRGRVFASALTVWRLAALAGALYLLHTTAALASVLPYDTIVAPGVLLGWLVRAALVIVLTVAFAVAVMLGI